MKFDFIQNMRRSLSLLAVIVASLFASETLSAESMWTDEGNYDISWYKEGQTEFQINNEREFAGLAYLANSNKVFFYNCKFVITSDLQLGGHLWMPIANGLRVPELDGALYSSIYHSEIDGGGHTISGMKIDLATLPAYTDRSQDGLNIAYAGLFGHIEQSTISNINLKDCQIFASEAKDAYYYIGTLAAEVYKVSNIKSNGTIKTYQTGGRYTVGGVVGYGIANGCEFDGAIDVYSGGGSIGGVVGLGSATKCKNRAPINFYGRGGNIGGILGKGELCNDCINFHKITVDCGVSTNDGFGVYLGGIMGGDKGKAYNCGNYGSIDVWLYSDFEGSNTLVLGGISPFYAYNSFNSGKIKYGTKNAGWLKVGSALPDNWWVFEETSIPFNCIGQNTINGVDSYVYIDNNINELSLSQFTSNDLEEELNNTAIELTKRGYPSQAWVRTYIGTLELTGKTMYALSLDGEYVSSEIKPWWSQSSSLGTVSVGKACFTEDETVNVKITSVEGYKLRSAKVEYYDEEQHKTVVYKTSTEPEFSFAMPPYNCTLTCDMEAGSGIDDINADVDGNVTIYNLAGQELYCGEIEQANLAPGVYIVKSASSVKKIIVK